MDLSCAVGWDGKQGSGRPQFRNCIGEGPGRQLGLPLRDSFSALQGMLHHGAIKVISGPRWGWDPRLFSARYGGGGGHCLQAPPPGCAGPTCRPGLPMTQGGGWPDGAGLGLGRGVDERAWGGSLTGRPARSLTTWTQSGWGCRRCPRRAASSAWERLLTPSTWLAAESSRTTSKAWTRSCATTDCE